MKTARMKIGTLGERLAAEYLITLGHKILERNWRYSRLEIDIITLNKDGVHFVEVKSRVAPVSANPLVNVTADKRRKLVNAALKYIHIHLHGNLEVFFDVITIIFNGGKAEINYFPQAFMPIYL